MTPIPGAPLRYVSKLPACKQYLSVIEVHRADVARRLVYTLYFYDSRYANATLGQRCIIDSVTYIDVGPDDLPIGNIISRHNCRTPQFYCDRDALQCFLTKPIGLPCTLDQECQSVRARRLSTFY